MIVVLMGVSGIGKTTLGQLLAARTGWQFEDAVDYHSEANRQKMAAGIQLTDADPGPWLEALHERTLQYHQKGENVILTCSALRSIAVDGTAEEAASQILARLREAGQLKTGAQK